MNLRNWLYQLRGGIIGILLLIITIILFYFTGQIKIVNYINQCLIPPCSSDLHFYLFDVDNFLLIQDFIIIIIISLIFSFVIGAIIGWIISKIKSRK